MNCHFNFRSLKFGQDLLLGKCLNIFVRGLQKFMPTRVVWYCRSTVIVHLYSQFLPETLEIIRMNHNFEDLVDTNGLKYNSRFANK